jgi:hypothetical protein
MYRRCYTTKLVKNRLLHDMLKEELVNYLNCTKEKKKKIEESFEVMVNTFDCTPKNAVASFVCHDNRSH